MNPRSSAQDVHQCDLCKAARAHRYKHGYDKQTKVSFQERRSTLIYPKCEIHSQEDCKFQCKDCKNVFVCSSCTASKQHRGHDIVEVTKVYKTKKEVIKNDTKELENQFLPTYEEITLDLENHLANLETKKEVIERDLRKIETEISPAYEEFELNLENQIEKPIDSEKLHNFLGQITPSSTATDEKVLSLNQPNTSVTELLDEPELVTTIQTGHSHSRSTSVACINEESIWTSGWTDQINCYNIEGSLLQTIKTELEDRIFDIAVDSDGNLLYISSIDPKTRILNKVKHGKTKEIIRLVGWRPVNLCVSSTGIIMVSMVSDGIRNFQTKVVCYSGSTEKKTIQFDNEGKPLYSDGGYVVYITENRNYDICVADYQAGAVVVVNQDGKLRWRYTGVPTATKNKPFKPSGITTDSKSHILTGDCDNHCIHILDQNGQFLRYIDNCNLQGPFGLCVDNSDSLFVGDSYSCNVKKIKYIK